MTIPTFISITIESLIFCRILSWIPELLKRTTLFPNNDQDFWKNQLKENVQQIKKLNTHSLNILPIKYKWWWIIETSTKPNLMRVSFYMILYLKDLFIPSTISFTTLRVTISYEIFQIISSEHLEFWQIKFYWDWCSGQFFAHTRRAWHFSNYTFSYIISSQFGMVIDQKFHKNLHDVKQRGTIRYVSIFADKNKKRWQNLLKWLFCHNCCK